MAEEDKSSKTEKATPQKKRESKKKGQVAKSQDVGIAAGVLAAFGTLILMKDFFLQHLLNMFEVVLESIADPNALVEDPSGIFLIAMSKVAFVSLPVMLAVMTFAFFAQLGQVGFIVTGEQMKPKFSKINPVKGLKRWFAIKSLVELGKSLLKIVVTFSIGFLAIQAAWPSVMDSPWLDPMGIVGVGGTIIAGLFWRILPLLLAIAVLDYMFQRWQWERDLKMSRKDLKDEYKRNEGDPYMKQARKQFHQELSNNQSAEATPQSDVVVINPTQYAIAIKYEPERNAVPIILAKGEKRLADEIRHKAREGGVPVVRNKPLARSLFADCEVGEPVPSDLYRPVAEVLAYVFSLEAAAEAEQNVAPDGVHEPQLGSAQSPATAPPGATQPPPPAPTPATASPVTGGDWS